MSHFLCSSPLLSYLIIEVVLGLSSSLLSHQLHERSSKAPSYLVIGFVVYLMLV